MLHAFSKDETSKGKTPSAIGKGTVTHDDGKFKAPRGKYAQVNTVKRAPVVAKAVVPDGVGASHGANERRCRDARRRD